MTIDNGKSDHHIIQQPRETSGLVRRQQNHLNQVNITIPTMGTIMCISTITLKKELEDDDDDDGWKVVSSWEWHGFGRKSGEAKSS